ncbi:hypothetical protein [Pedobacter sp. GR22-6]|uniref:hypothetical protein n=1 Tax=Pedobacter sp. GR22-6 TaxID=3127957 RepID=UPI00307F2F23
MTTDLLSQLGISPNVRDFFLAYAILDFADQLCFNYGSDKELFSLDQHLLPITDNCWFAGDRNPSRISHVFIAECAMELIAFLERNAHFYKNTDQLLFIATGLSPGNRLLADIGLLFKKSKFTIVHGNDFLGRIWTVKVAGWLFGKEFDITYLSGSVIWIAYLDRSCCLAEREFNLNQVQLGLGLRLKVKTVYPSAGRTFIQQMLPTNLL